MPRTFYQLLEFNSSIVREQRMMAMEFPEPPAVARKEVSAKMIQQVKEYTDILEDGKEDGFISSKKLNFEVTKSSFAIKAFSELQDEHFNGDFDEIFSTQRTLINSALNIALQQISTNETINIDEIHDALRSLSGELSGILGTTKLKIKDAQTPWYEKGIFKSVNDFRNKVRDAPKNAI